MARNYRSALSSFKPALKKNTVPLFFVISACVLLPALPASTGLSKPFSILAGQDMSSGARDGLEVFVADYPASVETGGTLSFTAGVVNSGTKSASFDEGLMVVSGPAFLERVLYSGADIVLGPGQSVSKPVELFVPPTAPTGLYTVSMEIYLDGGFLSSTAFDIDVILPWFTLAIFPDTQYYTEQPDDANNPYYHQAEWIVENAQDFNISFVLHMGDLTNDDDLAEWNIAHKAHAILDYANVPYCVTPGNHDYPDGSGAGLKRDTANYNTYFGPWRFSGKPWYGGHMGSTNDNNYVLFEASGMEFIVVNIEFAPTKDALCWADDLLMVYGDRRAIIVTHCYLTHDAEYCGDCGTAYDIAGAGGYTVWEELAARHSNVFLVLSGHINDSEYIVHTGNNGNTVHEVLTDYQYEEPCNMGPCDDHCYGPDRLGNGWLRLLEFQPGENRIYVNTISAEEGMSEYFVGGIPWFYCPDYNEDPEEWDHLFVIDYDMTSAPPPYSYDDLGARHFNDRAINSDDSGDQLDPAVVMDPAGDFVITWADDRDNNGYYQIYARGFSPGGCERFADIVVNTVDDGQQIRPVLAADQDGNFVVAWQDDQDKDGEYEIYARGFDVDGVETFPDIVVNTAASGQQTRPDIAMDADGDFVIAWEDDNDGNGYYQIYARGFNPDGTEKFGVFTVNTVGAGQQFDPSVAMDTGGGFVVTWEDDNDNNGLYQIYARGFDAGGNERFADFTVNSEADGQQFDPCIAMDPGGGFVVAWEDDRDGNGYYDIMARGFDAGGSELIIDFLVNSNDDGQQLNPEIDMNSAGEFIVVWEDDNDNNGAYQIYARGFSAGGGELFSDMTVNTDESGQQYLPDIAVGSQGEFISTWEDDMDRNGYYEILARGVTGQLP